MHLHYLNSADIATSNNQMHLNTIFYGPPGTGKTYTTLTRAVECAEPTFKPDGSTEREQRASYREKYEQLVAAGRIQFITFHQSLSYEDFIEGIKPLEPEKGDAYLSYSVRDGIFKRMCTAANVPSGNNFDDAYNSLLFELRSSETKTIELNTATGLPFVIALNRNNNLNLHTGPEQKNQGPITRENIIRQINDEQRFKWWKYYFESLVSYLAEKHGYKQASNNDPKNFVLIIDEINRGNVSQIFGELITLIEEDKRAGQEEALEVTLPYSGEPFSVPPNLYICCRPPGCCRKIQVMQAFICAAIPYLTSTCSSSCSRSAI